MKDRIQQSLQGVQQWVEARGYRGYDPGDGLTSYLRPLTFGNLLAERILQQAIWKSPINIRPLVGVKPLDSTKGRGFMAWGYTLLHEIAGDDTHRTKAAQCLEWLDGARETGHAGHCWGNHFDFASRGGRILAHTPTIVWSGLIGQAYLAAYDRFREPRYLEVCDSICRWILTLPKETTPAGTCLSYLPTQQSSVHNSNLLGAALLAKTGRLTGNDRYLATAREAARYSCTHLRPDGSWWYGEEPKYHWIDNFHTAYNLDSLRRYIDATGDRSFDGHLARGYEYFKAVFFEPTGRPRYYHDRTYPVDIQCASQAIDTFAFFSDRDPAALSIAMKIADWTISTMQDRTGYFYYREYPLMKARTPYFHWGQATMFKALAHLLGKLGSPQPIRREAAAVA
jgi:hypothetical protein